MSLVSGARLPVNALTFLAEAGTTPRSRDVCELLWRVLTATWVRREILVFDFPNSQVSKVRLVRKLKGASFWDVGTIRDVRVFAGTVSRTPHSEPRDVIPGTRFILLFTHRHWGGPTGPEVWLDSCGAVPLTEQNLDEVQRGIEEDYLAARGEGTEPGID